MLRSKRLIKFSCVESNTREWMTRSVVCKRRVGLDVGIIEYQLKDFGVKVRVHPIGETFRFVSFDEEPWQFFCALGFWKSGFLK